MDADEAWMTDLEDEEEPPEEEPEYWEDDEFTPEELTAWADEMEAASTIPAPTPRPGLRGGWRRHFAEAFALAAARGGTFTSKVISGKP